MTFFFKKNKPTIKKNDQSRQNFGKNRVFENCVFKKSTCRKNFFWNKAPKVHAENQICVKIEVIFLSLLLSFRPRLGRQKQLRKYRR
jgi:hypothetical protein